MKAIKHIRRLIGLRQTEFAELLGVHPMTVSKWERGVATPTPYQQNLIHAFMGSVNFDTARSYVYMKRPVDALAVLLSHRS